MLKKLAANDASSTTTPKSAGEIAGAQAGARVRFDFPSFFSITSPHPQTGCAGDAKIYLDYLDTNLGTAVPFGSDPLIDTATYKPGFIKNISVDLTDSNANVSSNMAYSCSYGANASIAGASSCSTFDYGAIGGVPTTLGGSLLLIGGIQNTNYSGIDTAGTPPNSAKGLSLNCGGLESAIGSVPADTTSCSGGIYALGVETVPPTAAGTNLAPGAAKGTTLPISSWSNLNSASVTPGPNAAVGSSVAFDAGTNEIAVFGGVSLFDPGGTAGSDTVDTWTYDITKQKWAKLNPIPNFSTAITTLYDTGLGGVTAQVNFSKTITPRALFGYVAVPNLSLSTMSITGTVTTANIDTTERIVTVGGLTSGVGGVNNQTYKFNPTFGPDLIDAVSWKNPDDTIANPTLNDGTLVQWIESYHTQLMSNSSVYSKFRPTYGGATVLPGFNFGMVPILDQSLAASVGYFMSVGGFDHGTAKNSEIINQGRMYYSGRAGAVAADSLKAGNFLGQPNLPGTNTNLTPLYWTENFEAGADVVPWFGGVSAHRGFNPATNDVFYFGGTDCRDFMTDSTLTSCNFNSSSTYYKLDTGPGTFNGYNKTLAGTSTAVVGAPARAGMASARGLDAAGRPIIVAWGGMAAVASTVTLNDDNIYVAYNTIPLPGVAPAWTAIAPSSSTKPARLTNAAMVFSHVTGKFYLFGGYQTGSSVQTNGDTYELSVSGCGGTPASCHFNWRQLNVTGGLSCYPTTCPPARRSHRMVEVNYNNASPTVEAIPSLCTGAAPCSYGIFMEGGTGDGFSFFADRWMFDPTGSGGNGHWQQVDGFPPRHLASMASVDYTLPDGSGKVHRAIMFGGETGLQNPERASSDGTINQALSAYAPAAAASVYLPPTLGDSSIFDFDNNSWQRVQLLGKGYNGAPPSTLSPADALQSYDATASTTTNGGILWPAYPLKPGAHGNLFELSALSPPATSGAVMITRTMSGSTASGGTALMIPEVFMFGGRLKDGTYATLDNVYKFCAGTTGERPYQPNPPTAWSPAGTDPYDDASCDGYDEIKNPASINPTRAYVGRWLKKNTVTLDGGAWSTASTVASFMGAGAYDATNDRIVLYGGLTSAAPAGDHVTHATRTAHTTIYEYTPPSKQNPALTGDPTNGAWNTVPVCATSPLLATPTARYGHTMGYDALNHQLIVVGGYDANGTSLTQTQTDANGSSYTIPEVWTAKKVADDNNLPAGVPSGTTGAPCYYWEQKVTFGNSMSVTTQLPPTVNTAFSQGSGLAHMGSVFVPSTGYNSSYYSMQDQFCANAGPMVSSDPAISKLNAGGAYIDIDRSALGPNENILLNLTYIPMGVTNTRPDGQNFSAAETAVLKVHLISSGESALSIQSTFQPRYLKFADTMRYAHVVQEFQVLAPPNGAVRQDQMLIPLGIDPSIDRIRVERVSGTAILIDATVVRTGYR